MLKIVHIKPVKTSEKEMVEALAQQFMDNHDKRVEAKFYAKHPELTMETIDEKKNKKSK